MVKLKETLLNDLKAKKKMFEDQERAAVREVGLSLLSFATSATLTTLTTNFDNFKNFDNLDNLDNLWGQVACQERSHYTTFAACLKPLVVEEVAMLR